MTIFHVEYFANTSIAKLLLLLYIFLQIIFLQNFTYLSTGGYLTTFADSFSFLTIRYAGHEVPAYQPQKALHMLKMFLDGSMFDKTGSSGKGKGINNVDNGDVKDSSGVSTDGSADSKANTLSLVMSVLLSAVALLGLMVCFRKQLFVTASR